MAKVTVKEVKSPHESIRVAVVNGGAIVKWYAKQAVFSNLLKPGAECDVEVEEKDGKYGKERWVVSVNGQTAQQRQGFGSGGFKGTPKDDDSIAVQVLLKEAFESARLNATHESRLLDLNEVRIILLAGVDMYHDAYNKMKVKP